MDKTANSYDDVRLATETAPDKDKGPEPGYAGAPDPEIDNLSEGINIVKAYSKGLNADALFYGFVVGLLHCLIYATRANAWLRLSGQG